MSAESLKSTVSSSTDFSGKCGVMGKLETMEGRLDSIYFRWYRLRECNQPRLDCQYREKCICKAVNLDNPAFLEAIICAKS